MGNLPEGLKWSSFIILEVNIPDKFRLTESASPKNNKTKAPKKERY